MAISLKIVGTRLIARAIYLDSNSLLGLLILKNIEWRYFEELAEILFK
jgi:hypothetical protein